MDARLGLAEPADNRGHVVGDLLGKFVTERIDLVRCLLNLLGKGVYARHQLVRDLLPEGLGLIRKRVEEGLNFL